MKDITFGSVCSGIEAGSVAWHRFGWRAAWLAEVSPWPARALHHHYGSGRPHFMLDPEAEGLDEDTRKEYRTAIKAVDNLPLVPMNSTTAPPNLGDMTRIEALVRSGAVAAPDILCGGTPCQAFSIAGLRESMEDARGQLTLSFVRLADAIDTARHVRGEPPATIVWENVCGVISTKDNAFGAFLGALAGEDSALVPPGTGWSNAGCVFGPRRTVAWRVYDAQYFGVAQRRRRVFVVASARAGVDPSEILFEFEGVRRDIAPSRQAGQDTAGTITSSLGRRGGATAELGDDLAGAQRASSGGSDKAHVLAPIAFSSKDFGGDAMFDLSPTLRAGGHSGSHANAGVPPAISYAIQAGALRTNPNSGPNGVGVQEGIAYTLEARAEVRAVVTAARDVAGCITSNYGKQLDNSDTALGANVAIHGMAVRRLTPRECERLQGFPDDYTLIPMGIVSHARAEKILADGDPARQDEDGNWWKMSADGPRYKALGNSWAVPNVVWIGNRLNQALRAVEVSV